MFFIMNDDSNALYEKLSEAINKRYIMYDYLHNYRTIFNWKNLWLLQYLWFDIQLTFEMFLEIISSKNIAILKRLKQYHDYYDSSNRLEYWMKVKYSS